MKRSLLMLIIFFLACSSLWGIVQGDTLTINGRKILKIWGSHQERGYAYGYLMGEAIQDVALNYFLSYFCQNNPTLFAYYRSYFDSNFQVEAHYVEEAAGLIVGMQDAGTSTYSTLLGRDLDETDVLVMNCLVDLTALQGWGEQNPFGCSSLSSWGTSTDADPQLNGSLVITRNMDWQSHPVLLNNHLLVVSLPSEPDELNWISISFPGLIGALSAVNSLGSSAFLNVGNYNSHPNINQLHPILFSVRDGLEKADFDGGGFHDPNDIAAAVAERTHLSGTITHAAGESLAVVIETNNQNGTVVRTIENNTVIPGENLVATNHFRLLYPPVYCYRYNNFADSLLSDPAISPDRSWNITTGAGGVSNNLHTIQYIPAQGIIRWSAAIPGIPAYLLEPSTFLLDELFDPGTLAESPLPVPAKMVTVSPNPFHTTTTMSFDLPGKENATLSLYN
ncbi:MAG: hypothetical protein JW784_02315, partial [Candidatus Cloacimonetes bacterium]|nr:hypothetical protein [Candidatus Cloacimonadota bacterium]